MVLVSTAEKSKRKRGCCWQRSSHHGQFIDSKSSKVSLLLPSTPQVSFSPPASPSHGPFLSFPLFNLYLDFLSPFEGKGRDSGRGLEEKYPKMKHLQGLSTASTSDHPYRARSSRRAIPSSPSRLSDQGR